MKVTAIAWQGYVLPFRDDFRTAQSRSAVRHGLLLWVRTDRGDTGLGEASPVGPSSLDEVQAVAAALERVAPDCVGADLDDLIIALDRQALPAPLRFGLETALLDLQGKSAGRSLSVLLGNQPASIPLNALVTLTSPEEAAAAGAAAVEQGFSTLKLKIGTADDERLVGAVREAVGPDVKLRLDPNMAWEPDTAIEAIHRLARFDIEYVEQPVPSADITGMAAVRRAVPVPLAADESLTSAANFRKLLDAGAADVFILKAARLGGLEASLAVAAEANAAGKRTVVTTALESGVGVAAAAHLASALEGTGAAQGLGTGGLFAADFTMPRLVQTRGKLQTPTAPGLGVAADNIPRQNRSGIIGSTGSLPR